MRWAKKVCETSIILDFYEDTKGHGLRHRNVQIDMCANKTNVNYMHELKYKLDARRK